MSRVRETIDAKARNLRELMQNRRYSPDFSQREYRGERQISELLEDLTKPGVARLVVAEEQKDVAAYSPYFLGSIVGSSGSTTIRRLLRGISRSSCAVEL
jgi:hypothetical protein